MLNQRSESRAWRGTAGYGDAGQGREYNTYSIF